MSLPPSLPPTSTGVVWTADLDRRYKNLISRDYRYRKDQKTAWHEYCLKQMANLIAHGKETMPGDVKPEGYPVAYKSDTDHTLKAKVPKPPKVAKAPIYPTRPKVVKAPAVPAPPPPPPLPVREEPMEDHAEPEPEREEPDDDASSTTSSTASSEKEEEEEEEAEAPAGGAGKPASPEGRKCGKCRLPGHTKAKCPKKD
jgi:type IV secretory pathway VirB10-like protein